jgi:tRNA (guanosine-2'-O-)-methyltransferase
MTTPDLSPHANLIRVRDQDFGADKIIEMLSPFVSDERKARIDRVISRRTNTVVPVVEGVYDMGNVSAVMRSAEALGYQSVHVVESAEQLKTSSRTTQGADKWLDVRRWKTTKECLADLKEKGYRIVVTHLEAAKPIDQVDFTRPTALVFGNEAHGISSEMLSGADERCIIPMLGFVESFNISVAAAVALYHAYQQRVDRLGAQGDLGDQALLRLKAEFYFRSVKEPESIIARLGAQR